MSAHAAPGVPTRPADRPRITAPPPPASPAGGRARLGGKRYFVQLGAFSRQATALRARQAWTWTLAGFLRHHACHLGLAAPPRPGLWRVVVAQPFPTRQAAAIRCRVIQARGVPCAVAPAWRGKTGSARPHRPAG